MKKNYIIQLAFALCATALVSMASPVSAQGKLNGVSSSPINATPVPYTNFLSRSVDNSRTIVGEWLDYWNTEDGISVTSGNTPGRYYVPLFSDSTVIICSSNTAGCERTPVHLMGSVFDASSNDMQQAYGYTWNNTSQYWIDSLRIFYSYTRNSDPSIVDTLAVYLINDSAQSYFKDPNDSTKTDSSSIDLPVYDYYGGSFFDSYGDSTVSFALIRYDTTGTNMATTITPGVMKIFKIPLTNATPTAAPGVSIDTLVIDTKHFSVPAGKLVASAFGFIPGYTYSLNDTISSIDNVFYFYSDQPIGANPYDNNEPPYTAGDWNVSEIVDDGVRYNTDTQGFIGLLRPSYSFIDIQPQEHLISYFVSGNFDDGIKESVSSEGTILYQNQPNPANNTTLIKYETKSSGSAMIEVRDLAGRLVMEMNQGIQSPGVHSVTVDLTKISNGMYLYTLKTNDESLTRRMAVSQ